MPPYCASATVPISGNATAAQAQVAPPRTAYRPKRFNIAPLRRSLHVGSDLHLRHHVGMVDRLALLELVDHVHAGDDLADHGVLAVQEVGLLGHDEELAVGRIVVAALARHA